jgi:diacylglycerol kinase family enzyme
MPSGTGNDFAASLGIHTVAMAIEGLVSGRTHAIDVIEARCINISNGDQIVRHALLFAAVGIIGESLKKTNGLVKRVFGRRFAYTVGLAWAICSYRAPLLRVVCDTASYQRRFLFAGASNSDIAGGGMRIAPGAKMDDGKLNINLVEAVGRWQALQQLGRLRRGQHTAHPAVRYFEASKLEVDTEEALEVAADGELIGYTPARFLVRPKVLRVCVP